MRIEKRVEDKTLVVKLEGRLDTITAPELETSLEGALENIDELIMDLEKLEYISSAGLRVLLLAAKAMNRRNGVTVINTEESVMEVFEMTGFTDILTIR